MANDGTTITVSYLSQKMPQVMDAVAQHGAVYTVTRFEEPVAKLVPITSGKTAEPATTENNNTLDLMTICNQANPKDLAKQIRLLMKASGIPGGKKIRKSNKLIKLIAKGNRLRRKEGE